MDIDGWRDRTISDDGRLRTFLCAVLLKFLRHSLQQFDKATRIRVMSEKLPHHTARLYSRMCSNTIIGKRSVWYSPVRKEKYTVSTVINDKINLLTIIVTRWQTNQITEVCTQYNKLYRTNNVKRWRWCDTLSDLCNLTLRNFGSIQFFLKSWKLKMKTLETRRICSCTNKSAITPTAATDYCWAMTRGWAVMLRPIRSQCAGTEFQLNSAECAT